MATLPQYVGVLEQRMKVICQRLGMDYTLSSQNTRVIVRAVLVLLSVVIKTLVDKGVATDAEFTATLNAARDEPWPLEPIEPDIPPVT